ncbi:hypothetical protein BCR34DRAFT_577450 [Clohesyomyces aquaticus]|uniref:Uncharacterized protein n=1 Tax=Clohesyomyces aquaticus TaxID=1231657 RepID=A0A1Y1YJJ7_9PLEO|nr:hypothetical protein BCR34DRAFT_577450 [Clohesyomyces aquaticus]
MWKTDELILDQDFEVHEPIVMQLEILQIPDRESSRLTNRKVPVSLRRSSRPTWDPPKHGSKTDSEPFALHRAVASGSYDHVMACLSDGIDVNHRDEQDRSPLDLAIQSKSLSIIELLILRGADPTRKNQTGKDAYQQAGNFFPGQYYETVIAALSRYKGRMDRMDSTDSQLGSTPWSVFLRQVGQVEQESDRANQWLQNWQIGVPARFGWA